MSRWSIEDLRGRRTLLTASTGGHLTQLVRLEPRLGVAPGSPWLTFDTPQSRSLLASREVTTVPYISPRDLRGVVVGALRARRAIAEAEAVVSTGAAVALAALPQALLRGKPVVYVESISRTRGPSLTGRILRRLPRIGLYTQHPQWSDATWRPGPSVLSEYRREQGAAVPVRRILVTLGTIEPYRFDRLVDLVADHVRAHPGTEVVWQLGCTDREDLPGRVESLIPADELERLMTEADLVVTHAGVGIATTVLDLGKVPVLLDRRADLAEHVDDHQAQIFEHLIALGLAEDAREVLADPARAEATAGSRVTSRSAASGVWESGTGRELRVMQAGPAPATVGGMGMVAGTLEETLRPRAAHVRLRSVDSGGGRGRAGLPAYLRSLAHAALDEYDVLHLHVASGGSTVRKGLLAAIAAARHRPYVIHLHGGGFVDFVASLGPASRRALTAFFRRAAGVVVLGRVWRDLVTQELGVAPDRARIVTNGVHGIEGAAPTADREKRLLFLGTLTTRKAIPELCAAAGELLTQPEFSAWSLTVVGGEQDEPSGAALDALGDRIGDRLERPGRLTGPARDALYATSAVFVLPSRAEGLPLVMLEAMSAGAAVVVSDVGAVSDVLRDGENGLLVPAGDVPALRTALRRVMEDTELRDRLGCAAYDTWRRSATPEAMTAGLVDEWTRAVSARTAGHR